MFRLMRHSNKLREENNALLWHFIYFLSNYPNFVKFLCFNNGMNAFTA
jgi:hypothetical protein